MTYLTFGLILAALAVLFGAWCGYKQDNVCPLFSLLYMVTTGFGYLIGIGFRILKQLLS